MEPLSQIYKDRLEYQLSILAKSQRLDDKKLKALIKEKLKRLSELELLHDMNKEEHRELLELCFELGEISGKIRVSYIVSETANVELFIPMK